MDFPTTFKLVGLEHILKTSRVLEYKESYLFRKGMVNLAYYNHLIIKKCHTMIYYFITYYVLYNKWHMTHDTWHIYINNPNIQHYSIWVFFVKIIRIKNVYDQYNNLYNIIHKYFILRSILVKNYFYLYLLFQYIPSNNISI